MPPRTQSHRTFATLQQCKHAVSEYVHLAAALDPSRDCGGLASASTRQLIQLNRALSLLRPPAIGQPGRHEILELNTATICSAPAYAALVQLFSDALRILAPPDEAAHAKQPVQSAGGGSGSSCSPGSSRSSVAEDGVGARPATKPAPAASRPTGQHEHIMSILINSTYIIWSNLFSDHAAITIGGAACGTSGWVSTAAALFGGDAMAAVSRLLAADNRRPERNKLLSPADYLVFQQFLMFLFSYATYDERLKKQLLPAVATSHLMEHCAAGLVARACGETQASNSRRGGQRAPACSSSSSIGCTVEALNCFNFVVKNVLSSLLTPPSGPHGTRRATCQEASAAARQMLSGRSLQYFAAVQAVSQLYAADGGPLYGLPYDAVLPYITASKSGGTGGQPQEELSCDGLRSMTRLWFTSLRMCPHEELRPLRPRHLLALCLRTARAALGSLDPKQRIGQKGEQPQPQQLEGPKEQRQQPKAQIRQGVGLGEGTGVCAADLQRLGAAGWALLGPMELRRRFDARKCLGLAGYALGVAMCMLTEDLYQGVRGAGGTRGAGNIGCSGESNDAKDSSGSASDTDSGSGSDGSSGDSSRMSSSRCRSSGAGGGACDEGVGGSGSGYSCGRGSGDGSGGKKNGSSSVSSSGGGSSGASMRVDPYDRAHMHGTRTDGEAVGPGATGTAGVGRPGRGEPRASMSALLRDPSFAVGWWRLVLGIVRAKQQQEGQQQQQQREVQQQQQPPQLAVEEECSASDLAILLLPLDVTALEDCGGCMPQSRLGVRQWSGWRIAVF